MRFARSCVVQILEDAGVDPTARTWVGLAVLVLPMWLIAIDSMVLVFALADITEELAATGAQQLWILDNYSLMLAGLLSSMSSPGDRYGRRKVLLIGAALATAAIESFTTALSWTGGIAAAILIAVAVFAGIMLRGVSAQADLADSDH